MQKNIIWIFSVSVIELKSLSLNFHLLTTLNNNINTYLHSTVIQVQPAAMVFFQHWFFSSWVVHDPSALVIVVFVLAKYICILTWSLLNHPPNSKNPACLETAGFSCFSAVIQPKYLTLTHTIHMVFRLPHLRYFPNFRTSRNVCLGDQIWLGILGYWWIAIGTLLCPKVLPRNWIVR